jgi:hypothetical protein
LNLWKAWSVSFRCSQKVSRRKPGARDGLEKPIVDGSDAVPKGNRKSGTSHSSPRIAFRTQLSLKVMGTGLKRAPNPLKIGDHQRLRRKHEAIGRNSGTASSYPDGSWPICKPVALK